MSPNLDLVIIDGVFCALRVDVLREEMSFDYHGWSSNIWLQVGVAMTFTVEAGMLEHCNGALVELIPCSDSLSGKEAAPVNGPCCMAVSELMLTPECLCYAASTAQGFDMKEILGLPRACRLHVKHAPTCEGRVCLRNSPNIET